MYLTEEAFASLIRNGIWIASLLICLILLLWPAFRSRTNPLAWLVWGNLLAGLIWYGQIPAAVAQQAWFKSADPGYAAAAQPFTGRSLYIADPAAMREAAYSCYLSYSTTLCEMPVARLLQSGQLDFVEIGIDPIRRYSVAAHDPRCVDWELQPPSSHLDHPFILTDRMISAGLGICVVADDVPQTTASHEIVATVANLGAPSAARYWNVQLRDRSNGKVIDQFDGWVDAGPYLQFSPPTDARRPSTGPLADLLMLHADPSGYDRALHDRLLAEHGIDEDVLRAAVASPYQSHKASAIWLACRDSLQASLSPETLAIISAASEGLFTDNPTWHYPEDCRAWAR